MTPPPIDDPFPLKDLLSELLPALDFGESFGFGRRFDFDGVFATSDSSFYSGYYDESCSMSVEGYVKFGPEAHPRVRQRLESHPNIFFYEQHKNCVARALTLSLTSTWCHQQRGRPGIIVRRACGSICAFAQSRSVRQQKHGHKRHHPKKVFPSVLSSICVSVCKLKKSQL